MRERFILYFTFDNNVWIVIGEFLPQCWQHCKIWKSRCCDVMASDLICSTDYWIISFKKTVAFVSLIIDICYLKIGIRVEKSWRDFCFLNVVLSLYQKFNFQVSFHPQVIMQEIFDLKMNHIFSDSRKIKTYVAYRFIQERTRRHTIFGNC